MCVNIHTERLISSCGLNSVTSVLQGGLRYQITYGSWYAIKQRNQSKPNQTNV